MKSLDSISYNLCMKITPGGEPLSIMAASRSIFRAPGWEPRRDPPKVKRATGKKPRKDSPRGAKRAKRRVFELARCNSFTCFVTWTLSPDKINRYDYGEVVKRFGVWLDNRVRRRGLRYLAVAEHHKDGAIHFHGLCNVEALRLVDSGHLDRQGRVIYNLEDWDLGFTTAVKLDGDYTAVCHYISKYITKQNASKCGGRWYLHGGKLQEPIRLLGNTRRYEDLPGKELHLNAVNLKVKYIPLQYIECLRGNVQWTDQACGGGPLLATSPGRPSRKHRTVDGSEPIEMSLAGPLAISGPTDLIASWAGLILRQVNGGWKIAGVAPRGPNANSSAESGCPSPKKKGGKEDGEEGLCAQLCLV